mmetsp:Transcript_15885/g.39802  ORF Transcript_15885/g.39802 Transcript_15885/m.39802 type:complete len:140 (-) Transcript_15885:9-428(-)
MKAKGSKGTEEVANRVWLWAVATTGNLHVDALWCEHIGTQLEGMYPYLKPWGGKERTWKRILQVRFGNGRQASTSCNRYTKVVIPEVDLSSPAKKLLEEKNLVFHVSASKKSLLAEKESAKKELGEKEAAVDRMEPHRT